MRVSLLLVAALCAASARGGVAFDAGADLRVRHELMENVPGLPGGGVLSAAERTPFRHHMRFRPRVWGEVKLTTEDTGTWRLYARLADEFRWNVNYTRRALEFPNEVYLDNLYLDAAGVFDGKLDFRIGRQDIISLYGLDHIFQDGTPGDGSRSAFADVARATWHVDERSTLDAIFLMDNDLNHLRWGTEESKDTCLTALGPSMEPGMDDWGLGFIWGSDVARDVPYQLFAISKHVSAWHDKAGGKHPGWFRELLGFKTVPRVTEDFSLQFEGMSQVGANDDGAFMLAWSGYAGGEWRDASKKTWQPYVNSGLLYMSGDENASEEDGGRYAWDPMWSRAENESCLFQYGTLYGVGFWSNQYFWRTTFGLHFGAHHNLAFFTGPLFADKQDHLGGGNGMFRGLLSQLRYDFPLWPADRARGERFEILGHVIAEFFNPGDYFATEKPAWFVRWQVEFRF